VATFESEHPISSAVDIVHMVLSFSYKHLFFFSLSVSPKDLVLPLWARKSEERAGHRRSCMNIKELEKQLSLPRCSCLTRKTGEQNYKL